MSAEVAQKTQSSNHFRDLILLFAVPVGIAVFAALIIYVPSLLANPKHDFMYSFCNDYRCKDNYSVDAEGYVAKGSPNSSDLSYYDNAAAIRYYDTTTNSSKSLTLEEARRYRLNTSSKSPDGYSLTRERSDSGFLFWGDYDDGWYLKNGAKKKGVELSISGSYYSDDIKFLGWVQK